MHLFQRTKQLEDKIGQFLENIETCGDLFCRAFRIYLTAGDPRTFRILQDQIDILERTNDALRRDVENQLYAHTLLPDMRSDILSLIEGCDKIINKYQTDINLLSIERPIIPDCLKKPMVTLIRTNIKCVRALMIGIQAVLAGQEGSSAVQTVYTLEHRADLEAMALKEQIFQKIRLTLARRTQLKEFVYGIEKISDMAEDMADALSVFMVKHAA